MSSSGWFAVGRVSCPFDKLKAATQPRTTGRAGSGILSRVKT